MGLKHITRETYQVNKDDSITQTKSNT